MPRPLVGIILAAGTPFCVMTCGPSSETFAMTWPGRLGSSRVEINEIMPVVPDDHRSLSIEMLVISHSLRNGFTWAAVSRSDTLHSLDIRRMTGFPRGFWTEDGDLLAVKWIVPVDTRETVEICIGAVDNCF